MTANGTTRKPPRAQANGHSSAPQIISLRSRPPGEARDTRIPCFDIDGKVYTIAARAPVSDALEYMHIARTQGRDEAVDFMLGVLLGEEGYAALRGFRDLEEDDLTAIINGAVKIMNGSLENPKGKR